MYWILAAILLLIMLVSPRLRVAGVVGLLILGALLAWAVVQRMRGPDPAVVERPRRSQPTSPAAPIASVPLDAVSLENLQLAGSGAPFELRGTVVNRTSDLELKSVTILITRRDCYERALDPSGCEVLWQDRHWTPVGVPPEQSRDFSTTIWMHGSAPRPRGEIRDRFELVAATGAPVKADAREERR